MSSPTILSTGKVSQLRPVQSTMILETDSSHTYYSPLRLPVPGDFNPTLTRSQSTNHPIEMVYGMNRLMGVDISNNSESLVVVVDPLSSSSLLGDGQQPLHEDWELEAPCDIELLHPSPPQNTTGSPLVPPQAILIKSSSADLARISRNTLGLAVG